MSEQISTAVTRASPSIPDYELLRPVGRGAYGEVWLARNLTGSFVALKIVHRAAFDHDRPFEREFEGIQRFEPISRSDPSQVAILHVGRGEGFFYYVMELADDANGMQNAEFRMQNDQNARRGTLVSSFCLPSALAHYAPLALKRLLNDRGALPAAECLAIALSLTRALAHLHGHGLVHRDVKPSNVIFVGGVAKLADIGLVTSVDATRSFVGTEGYLPPEGAGTPQADLYSLGKVLYEMCTGCDRKEFPALPPDIGTRPDRDDIAELNALVVRACELNPHKRYQCAEEMRTELERLERGKSVKRWRLWQQRVQFGKKLALATAFVALLAGVFIIANNELIRRNAANKSTDETFENSGTKSYAAWEAYRKGRFFLDQQTSETLPKGAAQFENAIRIDPRFAEAYAGMATAYSYWFVTAWHFPPKESIARAEKAARQALALKSNLAEALAALGFARFASEYHPAEAEALLRRAIRLDQTNERALQWLSRCLSSQSKFDEAIAVSRRALRLNPASLALNRDFGDRLFDAHRFQEAIEQDRATLELNSNHGQAWDFLAMACQMANQWTEARNACLQAATLRGETNIVDAINSAPSARDGALAFWRVNVADGQRDPAPTFQNPIGYAMLAAMAEDYEEAIAWLEKGVGGAESYRVNVWPGFDPLRKDPRYGERFTNVLRRIGFPP